ncbi:MAG: TetR/AcrR family transcriptional regulator [Alphaproteobacteria bacterium]
MSSGESDTRTRILEACRALLESGDNGVRMADIARRAGVSRQAVYLHFPSRADLLVATTRHIDAINDVDARLAASRSARTGSERLDAFIEAWGNYIPVIFGVARALIAMQDSDGAAAAAWHDRLQAVRQGCKAAVDALARDGTLAPGFTPTQATDILWTLLSVQNWRQWTAVCGWPQQAYIRNVTAIARRVLVAEAGAR